MELACSVRERKGDRYIPLFPLKSMFMLMVTPAQPACCAQDYRSIKGNKFEFEN